MGIKTIEQKDDRVKVLNQHIDDLDQAYKDGKISLYEYAEATKTAREEIEELSSHTVDTAIPAARDLSDVVGQAASDMADGAGEFVQAAKTKVSEGISFLETFSERIRDSFATNLASMLGKATTLKEGLAAVWGTAKEQFFTFIAQLVSKWVFGFVAKALSSVGGIGSKIASAFAPAGNALTGAAAGTGSGGLFGNLLGGIGKLAGPLGIGLLAVKLIGMENIANTVKGVWNAASDSIINSIKAIGKVSDAIFGAMADIVGGIGKAIGGLFTGIGALLGGGPKKGTYAEMTQFLEPMRWLMQGIKDILFMDYRQILLRDQQMTLLDIKAFAWGIRDSVNTIRERVTKIKESALQAVREASKTQGHIIKAREHLARIRTVSEEQLAVLKKLKGAAGGEVISRPTLRMVGENAPLEKEIILPEGDLRALLAGGAAPRTQKAGANIQITLPGKMEISGNITGSGGLDPNEIKRQVRDIIVPAILTDLSVNLKKREWQQALGVI